jgi:hypothetical protein
MSKTRAELVNEALTILGANPAGQEPSSEDYAHVDGKVEPVLDDLAARGVTVSSPSDIADEAFTYLAAVLAYHSSGYFGVVGAEKADLQTALMLAERQLRLQSRRTTLYKPVRAEYF